MTAKPEVVTDIEQNLESAKNHVAKGELEESIPFIQKAEQTYFDNESLIHATHPKSKYNIFCVQETFNNHPTQYSSYQAT